MNFVQVCENYPILNKDKTDYGMRRDEDYFRLPLIVAREMGFEPHVICFDDDVGFDHKDEFKVHRAKDVSDAKKIVSELKPSLIHTHTFRPYVYFLSGFAPNIHTPHAYHVPHRYFQKNKFLNFVGKFIMRRVYSKLSGLHTLTNSERDKFSSIGVNPKHFVIPFPVADEYYSVQRVNSDVFRGVTVANMLPRKNIETTVLAVNRLCSKYNYKHTFVGFFVDEEYKKKIMDLVSGNTNITFLDWKSNNEIPSVLTNADVFVSSSSVEGQMIAASEACAVGLPICSSNIEPMIELYSSCGLFHDVTDSDALFNNIEKLMLNKELYSNLSMAAKLKAEDFRVSKVRSQFRKMYEEILSGKDG